MPDPSQGPTPAIAPPGPGGPGAVQSGGPGGAPPDGGVLPPTTSAQPQNAPPQGTHQLFMAVMGQIMGALHFARGLADPSSEESKAADKMFQNGRKHFIPDSQAMKGQQMPPLAGIGGGAQPPPGIPGPGPGGPPGPANSPQMPRGPTPAPAPAGMAA